jgi:hypothetical protein
MSMNVKLKITKDGASLYEGVHDISDAGSFGKACADAWAKLRERKFEMATSIGALYEALDDGVLSDLRGARILIEDGHR